MKYHCKECNYKTTNYKKWKKHLSCRNHKRQTLQPLTTVYQCSNCIYRTLQLPHFQMHLWNCKKRMMSEKVILSCKEIEDTKEIKSYDIDLIKQDINNLLIKCQRKNIDPNKFMNYSYYARDLKDLSVFELDDFKCELQYIFN